ncbi:acyl-ACP--UDP-N-acetylglucosamine O-acyltransferase [bacterium]|nr:acyl-ACP--UDP-N-acetylglucosamine O-acyltransferase [bacterium]
MNAKNLSSKKSIHSVGEPVIPPAAIVHPDAKLGHDVSIGPFTIIGPNVSIGPECQISSSVVIEGNTTIGRGNRIFSGAVIGTEPQDLKYNEEISFVKIGDNNVIREYVTINLATTKNGVTKVGSNCLIMAYAHIAHECVVEDHVILANSVNLAGHVRIGEHAILGGMTPVHQFVRIGAHAFVGGGSRLSQDVPPFFTVAGNPIGIAGVNSVGLKRREFSDQEVMNLKHAYKLLYRKELNVTQALDRVAVECDLDIHIENLMAFIRRSERGIVR